MNCFRSLRLVDTVLVGGKSGNREVPEDESTGPRVDVDSRD